MYPRSKKFDQTILSNNIHAKSVLRAVNGTRVVDLLVTDGQISQNDESAVRRTIDCDVVDPTGELIVATAKDLLAPLSGTLLYAYRGLVYPDGTEEMIPVGVFTPTDLNIYDSGGSFHMALKGADKAHLAAKTRLLNPYYIANGTNAVNAIIALLGQVGITNVYAEATTLTVGYTLYEEGTDVWEQVNKLAESIGYEVWYDANGQLTLRRIPSQSVDSPAVWEFVEGEWSIINYLDKKVSDEDSWNYVVVIGNNPLNSLPIREVAFDNDQRSPTYTDGVSNVRAIVRKYSSITNSASARAAATALLEKGAGLQEFLQISCIPHPAFEVGDVVYVKRTNAKIDGKYVITKVSLPLNLTRDMPLAMERRRAM
jgi:hypothetical protein